MIKLFESFKKKRMNSPLGCYLERLNKESNPLGCSLVGSLLFCAASTSWAVTWLQAFARMTHTGGEGPWATWGQDEGLLSFYLLISSALLLLLLLLSRFSRVQLCTTPETAVHQAPLSLGFSRQEHWSGLPFPSPMHESEKWKWKWSRWVVSDSSQPHGLQPTRLFHPWDFPDKSTGVECHCLLHPLP